MRKTEFTKFLNHLTEEELRSELDSIYTKFKAVKDHYAMELGTDKDRKAIFDKAKTKLKTLYKNRKTRSRISKCKEELKRLEGISIFEHELADLYLYHVEVAIENFTRYYYFKDNDVNFVIRSFDSACQLVRSSQSEEKYDILLKAAMHNASEVYGLEELLFEKYEQYY